MQQTATSANPAQTFAGLLASIAIPAPKRSSLVDLDGLEDDVATLTYERALNAHARYHAPQATDRSLTQAPEAASLRIFEAMPSPPEAELSAAPGPADVEPFIAEIPAFDRELPQPVDLQPRNAPPQSLLERNLKTASITIRLSIDECDQLRTRAAEAGLTVSAYLRSCTFEAESLRAMVRDTMAQLRSEDPKTQRAKLSPLAALFAWMLSLRPLARGGQLSVSSRENFSHASFTG